MLFHLGAGAGGMEEFCNRYTPSFHRWWDDLGQTRLDQDLARKLADGIDQEASGQSVEDMSRNRDALISALLRASSPYRTEDDQARKG